LRCGFERGRRIGDPILGDSAPPRRNVTGLFIKSQNRLRRKRMFTDPDPEREDPSLPSSRFDRILGAAMLAATLFVLCFSLATIE
jgi:hypothetical protein